ncbi:unnamed protein product [Didymodactylos carnosus]|uniref:Uncharacterized protein n=1 Tax=Didymodactylos carnosus TaxID=1234261 RepID=A0A814QF29_9BILA|nr:unnamed protein product [Didymodactylos carnosus]CAF1119114.1 unnamed protein product [Didymodactylos carnosus]CAF3686008.1 unnamed protein product [Didymodactylos carnosus]CAF3882807.1 unnamed protein product [Didymodactylos carnosus]
MPRTRATHQQKLEQLMQSKDKPIISGVTGESFLAKLVGFHPVNSLPFDLMHDFAEGVYPLVLLAILKEASSRHILTYAKIEERIQSFQYGVNDAKNKPPIIRIKHLANGHIVGSASQKMCIFKLIPIILHDILDRPGDTLDIYVCLRKIISILYCTKMRRSWLPYLATLTTRFQSLMVNRLPNNVIPKVHFVTEYPCLIAMNGPPTGYDCDRFEGKHLYFKQLAIRSFSFKNPPLTLAKRHQLRQCLLLSNKSFYNITDETTWEKTIQHSELSLQVQRLLNENGIAELTYIECKTISLDHVKIVQESAFVFKLVHEEEIPCFIYIR